MKATYLLRRMGVRRHAGDFTCAQVLEHSIGVMVHPEARGLFICGEWVRGHIGYEATAVKLEVSDDIISGGHSLTMIFCRDDYGDEILKSVNVHTAKEESFIDDDLFTELKEWMENNFNEDNNTLFFCFSAAETNEVED